MNSLLFIDLEKLVPIHVQTRFLSIGKTIKTMKEAVEKSALLEPDISNWNLFSLGNWMALGIWKISTYWIRTTSSQSYVKESYTYMLASNNAVTIILNKKLGTKIEQYQQELNVTRTC